MGRIRTIKPEFPQSESMGGVSRDARLCFILMWTLADDSGRLRASSRLLASLLFPYDEDAQGKISGWLQELADKSCIQLYEVDGAHYAQVNKWLSHQKIDRPSESKIPPPPIIRERSTNPREPSLLDQGPRTKDSEAKASGVPPKNEPQDLKAEIFGAGLRWLIPNSGLSDARARAWLGKLTRDHGEGRTLEVLMEAQRDGPIEAVSWIEGKLAAERSNGKHRNGSSESKGAEFARVGFEALQSSIPDAGRGGPESPH